MATGAAGDGFIRGMFEGCISGGDMGIQRRPYHKNCKCALHDSRGGHCSRHSRYNNVSYPIRRAWSETNLALMMHNAPPQGPPSGHSSPSCSSSPAAGLTRTHTHMVLCKEEEEDLDYEEGDEMQGVAFSISMSKDTCQPDISGTRVWYTFSGTGDLLPCTRNYDSMNANL